MANPAQRIATEGLTRRQLLGQAGGGFGLLALQSLLQEEQTALSAPARNNPDTCSPNARRQFASNGLMRAFEDL